MDEVGSPRTRRGHDLSMLDAAYEKYAARLFDYCLWSTGDPEAAEDAVHAALLAAYGRPGLLRDNGGLRAWLYAAARNECLRGTRRPARTAPATSPTSGVEDPTAKLAALEELARIRRVTAGFTRPEQDVAELALRHRLVPPEVAQILGRPESHIRTVILRVHSALSARCGEGVLVAFAAPPPAVPETLYARIRGAAAVPDRAEYFAERAGPYTRSGYPVPFDRPRPRVRTIALVSGVSCAALLALAVVIAQTNGDGGRDDRPLVVGTELGQGEDETPSSAPTLPEPSRSETPTLFPLPSPNSPTPSEVLTTAPPPKGTGATPTIRLSFRSGGGCPSTWTAVVTAVVEGNVANEVRVAWWTKARPQPQQIVAAAADERTFLTSITGLPYSTEVFFKATAVSVDNRTGETGAYPVTAQCR